MKLKKEMDVWRFLIQEEGAVFVTSLLMLVILTVIGVAATSTSVIETWISGSAKNKQAAFYVAEAGLEHGKIEIADDFDESLEPPMWTNPATVSASFEKANAVKLIDTTTFGDYTYTVYLWKKDNNTIFMRSEAEPIIPGKGKAAVEISLWGGEDKRSAITGYIAQAGAGAGKNFNANDAEAIGTFNDQLIRSQDL